MPAIVTTSELKGVKCKAYNLAIQNGPSKQGPSFSIDFKVTGDDGQEYILQVKQKGNKTGLILKILDTITKFLPANDFTIQVDSNGLIVDISY